MLIDDEFSIWPNDRESVTAFFSLVSDRYERGSIILTSNKGFADWGEMLGDNVIATAVLDRLLHHSYVMNIRGRKTYRLNEKRPSRNADLTASTWRTILNARGKRAIGDRVGHIQLGENGTIPAWR